MGFFSKLFKGPEVDMEKSRANANKMRILFNQVVENGDDYQLIFGYTEDVARFNYGFVHGSKTKIGNLIVGWNAPQETIVVVPTVPDLSGCGDPTYYRRGEILKAYRNKYPTDAFIIYPDKKGYIGINAYDWLDDENLYVYVSQEAELAAFTDFFMPLAEIGTGLLIFTGIVIFGNLWFHFVDSILERIKAVFTRHKEPPAWHPFPSDSESDDDP